MDARLVLIARRFLGFDPLDLARVPLAAWRVIVLAVVGRMLGVAFQVGGVGFGVLAPVPAEHHPV